jgi:hypothetical protein
MDAGRARGRSRGRGRGDEQPNDQGVRRPDVRSSCISATAGKLKPQVIFAAGLITALIFMSTI